jgi:hypothetical protein
MEQVAVGVETGNPPLHSHCCTFLRTIQAVTWFASYRVMFFRPATLGVGVRPAELQAEGFVCQRPDAPKQKYRPEAVLLHTIEAGANGFACTFPQAWVNRF